MTRSQSIILALIAVTAGWFFLPHGSRPSSLSDIDLKRIRTIKLIALLVGEDPSLNENQLNSLILKLPDNVLADASTKPIVENMRLIRDTTKATWLLVERFNIDIYRNSRSTLPEGPITIDHKGQLSFGSEWETGGKRGQGAKN